MKTTRNSPLKNTGYGGDNRNLVSTDKVATFLKRVERLGEPKANQANSRLIVALDATLSRQPTWDAAVNLQFEMFKAANEFNGLLLELVFFRGYDQCKASGFVGNGRSLGEKMTRIVCQGGQTQIEKVLRHGLRRRKEMGIAGLIYIGDTVEENPDMLCQLAGELGILQVPLYVFQEGYCQNAQSCFKEMARISGGIYQAFDQGAANRLRDILGAIAAYSSGGESALKVLSSNGDQGARMLLTHFKSEK